MELDFDGIFGLKPDYRVHEEDYRQHLHGSSSDSFTVTEFIDAQPRAEFEPVIVRKKFVYHDVYKREPIDVADIIGSILQVVLTVAIVGGLLWLLYWFLSSGAWVILLIVLLL
jgi:hypothetical protein